MKKALCILVSVATGVAVLIIPWEGWVSTLSTLGALVKEYILPAGSFVAAGIALWLGDLKSRWNKPKLVIRFNPSNEPYFHKLSIGTYAPLIERHGRRHEIFRPFFNSRIMVFNDGKSTAKKVLARVEKIEFAKGRSAIPDYVLHYHPTAIKWSGERFCSPVDIVAQSHFFLDLFWSKSDTIDAIFTFNMDLYKKRNIDILEEELMEILVDDIIPKEEACWNIWANFSFPRGIPVVNRHEGYIGIYIVINGENCNPIRIKANIEWYALKWNNPTISIEHIIKGEHNDINNSVLL